MPLLRPQLLIADDLKCNLCSHRTKGNSILAAGLHLRREHPRAFAAYQQDLPCLRNCVECKQPLALDFFELGKEACKFCVEGKNKPKPEAAKPVTKKQPAPPPARQPYDPAEYGRMIAQVKAMGVRYEDYRHLSLAELRALTAHMPQPIADEQGA